MLLTDACVDRDQANLDRIRAGAQRLLGQVSAIQANGDKVSRIDGRLRSLIDTAHWALERSLPTDFTVGLDRTSHAFRMLEVISIRPGESNQELSALLKLHESEISRAGRRLIYLGLAQKRKFGRINRWEITPRGTEVLSRQQSTPPVGEVFAKLFDALLGRRFVDSQFSEEDLIRQTNISAAAMRPAVQRLVEMGYLERETREATPPGRQALRVNQRRGCAVGVSVLRHEVRAVLTDAHAHQVDTKLRPLPTVGTTTRVDETAVVQAIGEMVDEWRREFQILGVGAEIAGHVDEHGTVRLSPPLRWRDVFLRTLLEERLGGLPVVVENDANALAIYEHRFGEAGGRMRSFAVVMITPRGEGIGSGLILNDELYRGNEGGAGEIGHYTVRPTGGRKCRCGQNGCLEAETGVESMIAKVRRATGKRGLTLKDITDLAIAGEAAAVNAIEYAGTMMGRGISFLMNTLDLEGVLLSGPQEISSTGQDRTLSSKVFLDAICNEAQRRLYPTLRGAVSMEKIIVMMPFKDLDRERGAASVLLDAITGHQAARQEMSRSILTEFTGQSA